MLLSALHALSRSTTLDVNGNGTLLAIGAEYIKRAALPSDRVVVHVPPTTQRAYPQHQAHSCHTIRTVVVEKNLEN